MELTVHIERLVLDGIALGPGAADRLREALVRELSAALRAAGPDLPPAIVPVAAMPSLTVPLPVVPGPAGQGQATPAPVLAGRQAAVLGRDTGRALAAALGPVRPTGSAGPALGPSGGAG